jgi:membrane-bound lytic murein transglycosylase D
MLRKIWPVIICLFLSSFAHAGRAEGNYFDTRSPLSDTADKKDSLKEVSTINDSKQEFKDLFIANTLSNGITIEQLNPQAISFVEDYMEKFGKTMEDMKDWGRPYFTMIDAILTQHNLPKELKYLAVIESQLKTNARSWAGAVGPWQFMPATARNMGLRIGKKYDERRDLNKSSHAASKYLTNLFAIYGDWLLVIAAYNGGPGKVNAAIKKSGSRDFWTLQKYLPAESRNHVKKFIATHYMMEGQGGITTISKDEARYMSVNTALKPEETANSKIQSISGRYNSLVIVKHITMDIAAFNKMNPDFDKLIASSGNYELHLPAEKMEVFLTKKPVILNESMQLLLNPDDTAKETLSL